MIGFVVNVLLAAAVLYNIHQSFKCTTKPNRRFYKHYFIVVSFLIVLDNALSFILYRIPYFKIIKLMLISWLSIPMGTGPHFIYNVYIKNIHKLFEGDIDSVINSFKNYFEQLKAKYSEIVNASKKSGKVEIGFGESDAKLTVPKPTFGEDSDLADASAVSDVEDRIINVGDEKKDD